jgi:uracil-DNA glycosylase family protein
MTPPPHDGRVTVRLDSEGDAAGFRAAARRLLRAGVEPERVSWTVAGAVVDDLFGAGDVDFDVDGAAQRRLEDSFEDAIQDATDDAAEDATAGTAEGGVAGLVEGAMGSSINDTVYRSIDVSIPGSIDSVAGPAPSVAPGHPTAPTLSLPAALVRVIDQAALHADRDRHALLYRLAWRLLHEPMLRHDPLDPDRLRAEQMARAVRREMHKMTAFVRFRPIAETMAEQVVEQVVEQNLEQDVEQNVEQGVGVAEQGVEHVAEPAADDPIAEPIASPADAGQGDSDPEVTRLSRVRHVAWFEPEHHVVEATAPFFARRFARMDWAILTPDRCVRWDGRELHFGPGARRDQAPAADDAERLWLIYYESIFNPARLKLAMMRKEMPRRYWKNLPEAVLIAPLAARAAERSGAMVAQGGTLPARRRGNASLALRHVPAGDAASPLLSLKDIGAATERCRLCPIGANATQAVPGEGPSNASLMIVGEQPGDQEDLRGQPFVGPAGRLLDRAFARLGWVRETLYLTNAVKHFKFELRGRRRLHKTPAQQEAAACLHWLESEIALIMPAAIIALGATAARSLLGRAVAVTTERGWHRRADGLPVLVTLHPAALLRMDDPAAAGEVFEQWLADLALANPKFPGPRSAFLLE